LLKALDLPVDLFPPIADSGTRLGPLRAELALELGLPQFEIVAGCSHDTGAAVVAVPAGSSKEATGAPPDWAYLSSGTWSLLGCELAQPNLSEACREANFTNEIGYGNSVRLLKNIAGLWLVQECRRAWAAEGTEYTYAQLATLAAEAVPFRSLVHPADDRFVAPGGMPQRIASFCVETGQPVPRTPGEFVRCCLESLALAYAENLTQLAGLIGTQFRTLHIVGGGSQNELLNQLAADASGMEVVAGPVEATAAGNVLIQAMALGHVPSLAAAREIVRNSFPVKTYAPRATADWVEPKQRFARLLKPCA
jgi:rhamnulokinase